MHFPVHQLPTLDLLLQQEADAYVSMVLQGLPATEQSLLEIKQLQEDDIVCQKIIEYSQNEWPDKRTVDACVLPYYSVALHGRRATDAW